MSDNMIKAGRVAIRVEGEFVNAYFAPPNTMEGAILLGSIRRVLVDNDRDVWEYFKGLMQESAQTFIKLATGMDAKFGEQESAPEHEKAGNA